MSFYTNVEKWGNQILFRGYTNNGSEIKKKIKYSPNMFLPTQKETEWASVYGDPVNPKKFETIRDCNKFIEKYSDVNNYTFFGNENYTAQFLAEVYPNDILWDIKHIRIGTIDIEVASDEGFPEVDEAKCPVISIAYKDSKSSVYNAWGLGDYNSSKTELSLDGSIQYRKCENEVDLLIKFLTFWQGRYPNIITGWNSRIFDIPYLFNRMKKVISEDSIRKFSPWGIVHDSKVNIMNRTHTIYNIYGVSQMDYLDVFKKFGYKYLPQESFKLDHIAHVILGEKKISYDEYGTLHSLYKNNYQKFIDYNIKDVLLVEKLDKVTSLMKLALTVSYKGGVNYQDSLGTTAIWDSIIYRRLNKQKIAVPRNIKKAKLQYEGGYVKPPKKGKIEWVCSLDLASLYPNLIVQYNMSPETLVKGERVSLNVDTCLDRSQSIENSDKYCVAANGACFRKDKQGLIPPIIVSLYNERKEIQEEFRNKKSDPTVHSNELQILDNSQMAIKILLNSLYGALGNPHFRYFDMFVAEGITLSGQLSIRWAERAINEYLNKLLNTDEDYVVAIDTDSLYIDMSKVVEKYNPDNPVEFLNKLFKKKIEKHIESEYLKLSEHMGCYTSRMKMKREVISKSAVWAAKKRYIMAVQDDEGFTYDEPKLKIMGLEAVKSTTPQIVRDKFKEAYKIILMNSEEDLQKYVKNFYSFFCTLDIESISFSSKVSDVDKWVCPLKIYKSSTPIHVRASILYNEMLKKTRLDKTHEPIKNGSNIKYCYLKLPNPTGENIIGFIDYLPKEFGLHDYIDYKTQFEKCFEHPLQLVTRSVEWNTKEVATLEQFFT